MPPVSKDTGPPQQRMPSPQNTKEQYFAEGDRYAQAGRYRQAIKSYGQAVALEGKDVMGCVEQGNASYYSRDYEKAIAYYDRAITLGLVASNDHAWIYAQRGDAYLMLNDHRMAMRDFDQALKIDPEFRWARVRVEKAKPT